MFKQALPGKVIRTAEALGAKMVTVDGHDQWVLKGQVIAYRDARGLAGLGDQYFILSNLI